MASMKDIKQRIANVSSTEQIIKAMDTIASSKLHKARAQLEGVRPIYYELQRKVMRLARQVQGSDHIFFQERSSDDLESGKRHSLYIVITSDRGFAGGYNSNILHETLKHMEGRNEKILVMGTKGYEFFRKRQKNIIRHIVNVSDSQVYHSTEELSRWLKELYRAGEVDEVFMAYTHFENVLTHVPQVEQLLPVPAPERATEDILDRTYEPDIQTVIDQMIPLYTHMNLFRAFSESHTSEQAARMVNMDAAGKNAEELIEDLTIQYNRERQAAITQELSEIVGGSNINYG